jgi:succinate-acetate transporter protein
VARAGCLLSREFAPSVFLPKRIADGEDSGIFFFTGPVLLLLATIFLWIQAQFFPMMVCGLFCVFWLSFGLLQLPTLGLAAAYSPTGDAAAGMVSKEMNAVIALYLLVWGFALGTFWLFTIRINAVFAGIFGFVTIGSWILSGAYWALSDGKFDKALKLQKVRGLPNLLRPY